MKKSLLALAVLGAFAGAASAQSSVTVYGIVDLGFQHTDTGAAAGNVNGIQSGGQSASRIGFKGVEDLGGGLAATFNLEATIAADTGSAFSTPAAATSGVNAGYAAGAGGFNRIATVGLQGAFGSVNLGRQTSAIKDAYDQIDPFGDGGNIAPISGIFFGGLLGGDYGRISNSVKYATPNFAGFKATAAYGFGEAAGSTGDNSNYGLGLGYANGPLNVQAAYHNQDRLAGTTPGTVTAGGAPTAGVAFGARENKLAFIGATYNFGAFKLHGAYADTKIDFVAGGETKFRNGMVGVSLPLGPGSLFASYSINDNKTAGAVNLDSQRAAVMYTYDLSKRTNLYTGYSHTKNDDGVNLAGGVVGENNSAFNVGIRHKF